MRHGETLWNVQGRLQGQSDSPLTNQGELQAHQVAARVKSFGITHIISSDLGRALKTADIIADVCACKVQQDPRLRELDMGVLEERLIYSLTVQEEGWRKALVDGTKGGCIPGGETMDKLAARMHEALNACRRLPADSCPLLVSHGLALGVLIGTLLGLSPSSERRLRLRNGSLSRIDYQQSAWLAPGWAVEMAGDISHLTSGPRMSESQ